MLTYQLYRQEMIVVGVLTATVYILELCIFVCYNSEFYFGPCNFSEY